MRCTLRESAFMSRIRDIAANLLLVVPHAAISLFLVLHHEPWRDETHAFLLARGPATITQLLLDIRNGEVSPPLWHLMLRAVSLFTDNFLAVSLLHWGFMVAAMALLVWFSPFRAWEKLLISLTGVMLFEYTILARHYGLSVLLMMAVLVTHSCRRAKPHLECLCLALLIQTNAAGAFLAAAWWLVVTLPQRRSRLGHLLVALSFVTFAYYMSGEAFRTLRESGMGLNDFVECLFVVGTVLLRTLLQFGPTQFWEPQWLLHNQGALTVAACFCAAMFVVLAPKRGRACAFCVVATVLLISLFLAIGRSAGMRHHGFLFLALVVALWMERADTQGVGLGPVRRGAWIVVLGCAIWGAMCSARADLFCLYSEARSVASRIEKVNAENQGARILWATFSSALCEGILAFLPRDQSVLYSLELERPYRYLVHDKTWKSVDPGAHPWPEEQVVVRFRNCIRRGGLDRAYLIVSQRELQPWFMEGFALRQLTMPSSTCLATDDEYFYIYEWLPMRSTP